MVAISKVNFPDRISLGGLYIAARAFPHQRKWIGEAVGEFTCSVPDDRMLGMQISGHISDSMLRDSQQLLRIVESFDLSTAKFSDNLIKEVAQFVDTVELRLDFTPFEDTHAMRLLTLSKLETIWFLNTAISNKSLRSVAQLPALKNLVLKKTEITDGGLVHLKELPELHTLLLPSEITDNGLEELSNMNNLFHLDISNTKVTDHGLSFAATMENLHTLCLNDTAVGDEGLKHLSGLKHLRTLYLSGTKITDKGLSDLEKMKSLEYLEIRDNKITEIALTRLRSALPSCTVFGP